MEILSSWILFFFADGSEHYFRASTPVAYQTTQERKIAEKYSSSRLELASRLGSARPVIMSMEMKLIYHALLRSSADRKSYENSLRCLCNSRCLFLFSLVDVCAGMYN